MRDPDPQGHLRRAKQAWHSQGIIVLFPEDIRAMDPMDRMLLEAVAAKRFGKRGE